METGQPGERTAAPGSEDGQPTLGRRAVLGMALAWALARPRWGRRGDGDAARAPSARAPRSSSALSASRRAASSRRRSTAAPVATRCGSPAGAQEMTTEIESTGILRDGRWAPLRFTDRFVVYGRESRLEITYDYARRLVRYQGRSETFLLRRAPDDGRHAGGARGRARGRRRQRDPELRGGPVAGGGRRPARHPGRAPTANPGRAPGRRGASLPGRAGALRAPRGVGRERPGDRGAWT